MRVLFTVHPAQTHMYNMVSLAWALRTAGHEVCLASRPNIKDSMVQTGLTTVPVGDLLDMENNPELRELVPHDDGPYGMGFHIGETRADRLTLDYVRGALGVYSRLVSGYVSNQAMLADLVRFARWWQPDLVIWDFLTCVGPVVAKAVGAAHARMVAAHDHFGRMRLLFHELRTTNPDQSQDDPMAAWLGGLLERFGGEFDEEMTTGQLTIDPLPPWMRFPLDLPTLPVRFVPYNGPAVIPDWLLEPPKRPRVCMTFGLSGQNASLSKMPIGDALESVADLDVEVVATLNDRQLAGVGHVPDNVRIVDFVPLNALLPSCAAIVHHVGITTLQTAMGHGVPQLLMPGNFFWSEPILAEQMQDRGAALSLPPDELSDTSLRAKLTQLLNEQEFTANARKLQDEMLAMPSPRDVVPELERLVATRSEKGSGSNPFGRPATGPA